MEAESEKETEERKPVEATVPKEEAKPVEEAKPSEEGKPSHEDEASALREKADALEAEAGKLRNERDRLAKEVVSLNEALAFVKNGVAPERENDVRAWFKGMGYAIDSGSLAKNMASHPEWKGEAKAGKFGNEKAAIPSGESADDRMAKAFGLPRFIG